MKKHYVNFYSPGTMVAEITTHEIDSWDTKKAVKVSHGIKERHGATPYGFCFTTRERKPDDFDSKETKRSSMYYLSGEIITLKHLKKQNHPDQKILISNMECNGWDKIVKNDNSWSWCLPLKDGDVILETA